MKNTMKRNFLLIGFFTILSVAMLSCEGDDNSYSGYPSDGDSWNDSDGNGYPSDGDSWNDSDGNSSSNDVVSSPLKPTNVSVYNAGSILVPMVKISWTAVENATSYDIYRSTSASGYYSKVGTSTYTYYYDESSLTIGGVYYYKVKAVNSAGSSDYSSFAQFNYEDTRKPGLAQYGSCSYSASTGVITLRWSVPSDRSYGKPTKAVIRVYSPAGEYWFDYAEVSGTTTSYQIPCGSYIDTDGFIRVGVILENDNGSGGGIAKVYDTKNKKWIN